eukprot:gene12746-6938_t
MTNDAILTETTPLYYEIDTTKGINTEITETSKIESIEGTGSFLSTTFASVQTSLGAGMLALPYAFKAMGIIPALFLILTVAFASYYTLWMLIKVSDELKDYNLKAIGTKLYGSCMGYLFEFGVGFVCFGCCAVYLILIGQSLSPIFHTWFGPKALLGNRIFLSGIVMICFILPLCASKSLAMLSNFSFISVVSSTFILVIIVIKFITTIISPDYQLATVYLFPDDYSRAFGAIPILFLAFGAHLAIIPLFKELKGRSARTMSISSFLTINFVSAFYIFLGIAGFFVYGKNTKDNVLLNFGTNELPATIAKFGLAIQLIMSYSLFHYVSRQSIESTLFSKFKFSWYRWLFIEGVLCGSVFFIAIFFEEIVTVFSLTSAVFGVMVFYIFPVLFYIKIEKLARSKSNPTIKDTERIERAISERIYMIPDRLVMEKNQDGIPISENFPVLGTTGNVYYVKICKQPECTCPDFLNGHICKHIFFVFYKVLKVDRSSKYPYQKALLSSELVEIFKNAPPSLKQTSPDQHVISAYQTSQNEGFQDSVNYHPRRPIEKDVPCPICFEEMIEKKERISFCEVCGYNIHQDCWNQWVKTNKKKNIEASCIFCRVPMMKKEKGKIGKEGYVNLAKFQPGMSEERPYYERRFWYDDSR